MYRFVAGKLEDADRALDAGRRPGQSFKAAARSDFGIHGGQSPEEAITLETQPQAFTCLRFPCLVPQMQGLPAIPV